MARELELILLVTALKCVLASVSRLESYNVDSNAVSISGISSGAAMATQMHVIYSRDIMGAGMIAGGNGPKIQKFYNRFVSESKNIKTVFNIDAEHCMPTESHGGECNKLSTVDYINNCSYNAAFDLLNFIYGGQLQKPSAGTVLKGRLLTFDQSEFFHLSVPATYSMDTTGYIYVPAGCEEKHTQCRLHVALHGCQMGRTRIKDSYVKKGGYNEVGELNNIIILYPQAIATPVNPQGCWDWWGYTGSLYATNKAFQPTAIKRMIDRVKGRI